MPSALRVLKRPPVTAGPAPVPSRAEPAEAPPPAPVTEPAAPPEAVLPAVPPVPALPRPAGRDARLDFFRGLALIYIFLDHIPSNVVAWITVRNYGFCDATEIFVFIAGYSATLAYGSQMRRHGFLYGSASLLQRAWQLYIAHIFLFVLFTAQIGWVETRFRNPMYSEEMNLLGFLSEPHVNLIQALLLRFRPTNMDVLPLYIALLLGFAPLLWLLLHRQWLVLGLSGLLYLGAGANNWNLAGYPPGRTWFFNPLCWQFLFVIGACCALSPAAMAVLTRQRCWLQPLCIAYLLFALAVVGTWYWPALETWLPAWLARLIYPIDKTNLDILRLLHFLALAYLVTQRVGPDAAFLHGRLARPFVICGRHSLEIFCLGTLLAFTGHFYLTEFHGALPAQIAVSVAGTLLMILVAWIMEWYRNTGTQGRPSGASA